MMKHAKILLYLNIFFIFFTVDVCILFAQEPAKNPKGIAREHYYQGVFYGKQGKYTEAVIELEKAIESDQAYADAYNALAVVYHKQKQYQKAIENYLLAIETEPHYVKARTNLAMIYNEQKQYRKAVRQLEKALKTDPDYTPAKNLIGDVRKKANEQDMKELERQQKSAKTSPPPQQPKRSKQQSDRKSAQSVFHQGTELIKQGKLDAGIQTYQKGIKLAPDSAEGHTLLGMAYREKYRLTYDMQWRQLELSSLTQAIKYNSRYIPALLGLGEVYYEQGLISEALPYFRKVLQYQPNHPSKEQLERIIQQGQ